MSDILSTLNPQQREACEATERCIITLAGPGSGKTRTLTHRIAYLIAQGVVEPWRILAVTFTNKAAREMKTRLAGLLSEKQASAVTVKTFHSFGAQFMRAEMARWVDMVPNILFDARQIERLLPNGIPLNARFSIYDDADRKGVMAAVLVDLNLDKKRYHAAALERISRWKAHGLTPRDRDQLIEDVDREVWLDIYAAYQARLVAGNALDFDDLLLYPLLALSGDTDLCRRWQNRFPHILVDEYQDTNTAQYELSVALKGEGGHLFVVGDDDQAIYGWRYADFRNVQRLMERFPDHRLIRLGQNYRSVPGIVERAAQLIGLNTQRVEKRLWTENEPDGDAPDVVESCYGDGDDEAAGIADCISELVADGTSPDEIAVLYRINALSRGLEKTMFEASLPYRMLRGVAFYERREVRDTLAYLQFLYNGDERAFTRIANVPKRGMGEKTLQAIIEAARSDIPALLSSVLRAANVAGKLVYGHLGPKEWQEVIRQTGLTRLKIGTIQRVHELAQIFAGLRAMVDEGRPVGDLVGELLDGEGVGLARYFAGLDEAGEDRVANARELLTVAARVEAAGDEGLAAFLELCSLGDEASKDVSGDEMPRITLGTLHSAKGLEWDYVFIAAAEQELAPGRNSKGADLEEERRLFYVGMTRARKRVTASWARFRVLYGEGQLRTRSQFIEEAGVEVES